VESMKVINTFSTNNMEKQRTLWGKDYLNGAEFSMARSHRYVLWRVWDEDKPRLMFIGLNPSTANENDPDPTITRITSFCQQWGYGGFFMLNLFTIISPEPKALRNCPDRCRKANHYLQMYRYMCDTIVFGWGDFKESKERAQEIIKMFPNAYCLRKNKDGSPRHPLYVADGTKLIPY
jgi:hypothetical protein